MITDENFLHKKESVSFDCDNCKDAKKCHPTNRNGGKTFCGR
jgi:hypothetical protein